MIRHESPISGVAAHGDRYVATAGYDNVVILWDAAAGTATARGCHDHLVNQCQFSPDGKRLVTASSDYTARVWSVPEMELLSVLRGHEDDVEMASFCPESRRVATASRDHGLRVFDSAGVLQAHMEGHRCDVISVEWSPRGDLLLTSGDDGTVRRWSSRTGELLETVDLGDVEVDTVVMTSHGVIYAGTDDGEIVRIRNGSVSRTPAHGAGIKRLAYDERHNRLVSTSYDRTVRLWDIGSGDAPSPLLTAPVPPSVWVRSCCFLGDSRIAFGTFGSSYATLDIETRQWDVRNVHGTRGLNAVRILGDRVHAVGDAGTVYRDGKALSELGSLCNFVTSFDGSLVAGGQLGVLFDVERARPLYVHRSPLNCAHEFIHAGRTHLIVGTYTGEGLIFARSSDGSPGLVKEIQLHKNAVKGVACNGRVIASVSALGDFVLTRTDTLEVAAQIPRAHSMIANGVTALSDGRFASVSRDRQLRLWSDEISECVATPHTHSIKCVAACPESGLIATGSYYGEVALYDPRSGSWTHRERISTFGISSLTPARTPGTFLASSYDGRVYSVPGGSVI